MTETTLIHALTAQRLQDQLQAMGYRVTVSDREGRLQLLSATQGIGFAVRPGNPAPTEGEFVDYTLSCVLRLEGSLPAGLVDSWNIQKRFARLSLQGTFLVLEMDVIVAGGVSANYVRATTELWDRLMQELVLFLREFSSKSQAATNGATATAEPADGDTAQVGETIEGAAADGPADASEAPPQTQRSSRKTAANGSTQDVAQ